MQAARIMEIQELICEIKDEQSLIVNKADTPIIKK